MLIFSSGCARDDAAERLNDAARLSAGSRLAVEAAEKAARLDPLPGDCRRTEAHGIAVGDRLDVAAVKAATALERANARVIRCAAWYDDIRASRHAAR